MSINLDFDIRMYMRGVVLYCIVCFLASWPTCHAQQARGARTAGDQAFVNYAELRTRLAHSLPEKANEIADLIDELQKVSKATLQMTEQISAHCVQ